ncbi:MAG: hypothetical protein Q6373_013220 [Candidatus Sigynarchaeota archaeon]
MVTFFGARCKTAPRGMLILYPRAKFAFTHEPRQDDELRGTCHGGRDCQPVAK